MSESACRLLYVTAADREEAEALARALLEARHAACVNILGDTASFYWWEGVIRQASECALLVKTTARLQEQAIQTIRSRHSYDCPCIVALPVEGGNPDFLRWVGQETAETV